MFCEQCGTKNNDSAKFCSSCGASVESSADTTSSTQSATADSQSNAVEASSVSSPSVSEAPSSNNLSITQIVAYLAFGSLAVGGYQYYDKVYTKRASSAPSKEASSAPTAAPRSASAPTPAPTAKEMSEYCDRTYPGPSNTFVGASPERKDCIRKYFALDKKERHEKAVAQYGQLCSERLASIRQCATARNLNTCLERLMGDRAYASFMHCYDDGDVKGW